jgi:hypothetical protein
MMFSPDFISLFKSIFYGRQDVHAIRWEKDGKSKQYAIECRAAKLFCFARAASIVDADQFNRAMAGQRILRIGEALAIYYQPGPGKNYPVTDPGGALWIPGDGGYIRNKSAQPKNGLAGENVIYLGAEQPDQGCFATGAADFARSGWFFGHGSVTGNKLKLQDMFDLTASWNENAGAEMTPKREYVRQPLALAGQ